MELSSTADQRFPKALDRCLKGTPKIDTDLLQRINRFASLGLPRRVPLSEVDDHGAAPPHVDDTSTAKETVSASEGVSENTGSSLAPKPGLPRYLDSRDVRKRRADVDASSCRECPQPKQTQIRASKNNLGPPANRKAIELAKEVFEIQDKENSSPRIGGQRREIRKQPAERSGEKRPLGPSNKLPNVQTGRKIGSLLTKGHVKATVGSLQHENYAIKENPPAASLTNVAQPPPVRNSTQPPPLNTKVADKQRETDLMNTSDSMSISQPPQLGALCNCYTDNSQKGMLVSVHGQAHENASAALVVDNRHRNFGSTSIGELSFSMSSLALSDSQCPEIVASLPNGSGGCGSAPLATSLASSELSMVEKGQPLRNYSPTPNLKYQLSNNKYSHSEANNITPYIVDAKQDALSVHVAQMAAFPVRHVSAIPSMSASACSITIGSGSAPLPTTLFSSEALMEEKGQSLRHLSPSLNLQSELLNKKCSLSEASAHHSSASDPKAPVDPLLKKRRQPSEKVAVFEGGTLKKGQDRSFQDENVMSEGGGVKLVANSHAENVLEKKTMKGEDPNVQLRKQQIETEHFVWVNGKRYQKMKKIGRGGSSEVYMVIDRDCNIYALKRIKLKGRDYATACGFYQEIEYLNKLRGKSYIICLIDHEVTDKNLFPCQLDHSSIIKDDILIYMVLEYGEIDLAHMLESKLKERSQGNNEVDETWLRFYWRQILEAVNTIHEERIVHSDLKPANFLLVKGALKLIDFGIAKSIQSDTTHIERDAQVGTLNYMSPEAFLMNEEDEHGNVIKCGRPSDIWSLGCILYQMVYGKTPFAHITKLHAKIQEVANPKHKIDFPPLLNPHLIDIMKKCLAWKKEERLRIPQLLNHPFLQPQLAPALAYNGKEAIDVLLYIQKEHNLDTQVKFLTNQLLDRLKHSSHAMDM